MNLAGALPAASRPYLNSMVTGTFSISNGPASRVGTAEIVPFIPLGTRHEYEQVPPQPYRNLPSAIVRPPLSRTCTPGADVGVEPCRIPAAW